MSIFKSGNPTLTQKIFEKSLSNDASLQGTMTVRGAINKFGFLLLMVMASAMYTWNLVTPETMSTANTIMITGAIGGFVLALVMIFLKRRY